LIAESVDAFGIRRKVSEQLTIELSELLSAANISRLAKKSEVEKRNSGKIKGIEILDLFMKKNQ